MKKSPYLLLLFMPLFFSNCAKDNVETVILEQIKYAIKNVQGATVGTVSFTEDINMTTEILIELTGTSTSKNPAFVRYNTVAQDGPIALTLKVCQCSISHTVVSKLDDGTLISFNGLVKLNGHISIQASPTDNTIIATADIGLNGTPIVE
ncbi:MAG: hypothetical protein MUO53_05415 [Maribacter sp.]|nr:hypothetical protein [Maribacter sp.]